jgi:DNA-binding NarL/FixJ family response regulator
MSSDIYREPLTKREKHVASLVTAGLADKQIADELGISVKTAKNDISTHIHEA